MKNGIIVIGGGHGAAAVVSTLRSEGYDGPLRLISGEAEVPYHRPPLSKAFLKAVDAEILPIKPASWYADNHVDLDLGVKVTRIDRAAHHVHLSDGRVLAYDKLALALGARVRKSDAPGADLKGIHYLRTTADARILRQELADAKNVVIVGGGFIGLEVAATAALLGKTVTVLEMADRLMGRAVSPQVSAAMLARHRAAGIDVKLNTGLKSFGGEAGRLAGVTGTDGIVIAADFALIGIGVIPEAELAREAGLQVDGGLVVDEFAMTSDPDIASCGDGVVFKFRDFDRLIRLESVQNANDQGRHAALALLGRPSAYHPVPWFWSDQGATKLQMVGLSFGADKTVLRGTLDGPFSVFHFAGDRLVSLDSVDRPTDHMIGRRLLAAGTKITPEQAADLSLDLKSLK